MAVKGREDFMLFKDQKIKFTLGNMNVQNIKDQIFCTKCYCFVTNMVHPLEKEYIYLKCNQRFSCERNGKNDNGVFPYCEACNLFFYDATCFKRHEVDVCREIKIFEKCDSRHALNGRKSITLIRVLIGCFMKPFEKKDDKWPVKNVCTFYYGVEAYRHNERYKGNDNTVVDIIPYLLVSQVLLYKEFRKKQLENCGTKKKYFT